MSIDPTRSPDIRAGGAERPVEPASADKSTRSANTGRGDQVEISQEGRSLAEQGGVDRVPFTEARAAEVQDRLASGFYDQPDVIRKIAERLVDSGEL